MQSNPLVEELLGFSDELVQIAERAVADKTAAEAELTRLKGNEIELQKVAAAHVSEALDALTEASLLPASNREKIASMLETHEGALEVLTGVVFLAVAPSQGGTPVSPPMSKLASAETPDLRGQRRKAPNAELQIWADLAHSGF
jgi:hypothetical protein